MGPWTLGRRLNAIGAALAFGLIAYALYAQHYQGYAPCLLCVLQRIAMIALGLIFLVAVVHNSSKSGALVYGALGAMTSVVGIGIATRHLYLQYTPKNDAASACGPEGVDGLLYLVEVFGPSSALRKVFYPTGDCATVDWTFIGLSMPAWVLIWFIALGALAAVAARKSRH